MIVPVDIGKFTDHVILLNKYYSETLKLMDTDQEIKKGTLVHEMLALLNSIESLGKKV